MEKVIRDGKVAVLVSPGFGAGWSTWADDEHKNTALFHPDFVAMVEEGRTCEAKEIAKRLMPGAHFYTGGADGLVVKWLDVGEAFRIDEYDGSESIVIAYTDWTVA